MFKKIIAGVLACGLAMSLCISSGAIAKTKPLPIENKITTKTDCKHLNKTIKAIKPAISTENVKHTCTIKNIATNKSYDEPCTVTVTKYEANYQCKDCGKTLSAAPLQQVRLHSHPYCLGEEKMTSVLAKDCKHTEKDIKLGKEDGKAVTLKHQFWLVNTSNEHFYSPCTIKKVPHLATYVCKSCGKTLGKAPKQHEYIHSDKWCPFTDEEYASVTPQPKDGQKDPIKGSIAVTVS